MFCLDVYYWFVVEECDWGFIWFVDLWKLYIVDFVNGKNRLMIENDEVEIIVFVWVLKDFMGVLWYNFVKWVDYNEGRIYIDCLFSYDFKKEIGYVGLKN